MSSRATHLLAAFFFALPLPLAVTSACTEAVGPAASSSSGPPAPPAPPDAGEAGAPSQSAPPPYPATLPSAPQVKSSGGTVLTTPRIVPVLFPGETDAAAITDAIARYAASAEWALATAQYGVGPVAVAGAVQSVDPLPDGLTTPALGTWIEGRLDGTHPEWGPVDQSTIASSIYVLYPPAGTTLYAPQQDPADPMVTSLCGPHPWDPMAWHWQTTPAPGPYVAFAFAVVGRCSFDATPVMDRVTAATTHELVEAATDPLFVTSRAYASLDDEHAFWMELTGGGEIADLCAQDSADLVRPPDVGYAVQRTWSNAAAAAGHDPCVPSLGLGGAYFNVTADAPDVFYDPYVGVSVNGVAIPPGQSRTIDVHLYSDAPTGAWKVTAADPNAAAGGATLLRMTLDRDTGTNGDVLHLTISPQFQGRDATALYELDSTLGSTTQRWYGEIVVR
jgi:hypothetical protein